MRGEFDFPGERRRSSFCPFRRRSTRKKSTCGGARHENGNAREQLGRSPYSVRSGSDGRPAARVVKLALHVRRGDRTGPGANLSIRLRRAEGCHESTPDHFLVIWLDARSDRCCGWRGCPNSRARRPARTRNIALHDRRLHRGREPRDLRRYLQPDGLRRELSGAAANDDRSGSPLTAGLGSPSKGSYTLPPADGPKLVSERSSQRSEEVSVQVFFPDAGPGLAGLIVKVNDPGVGDNRFHGYEVSLEPSRRLLVLGATATTGSRSAACPAMCRPIGGSTWLSG